MNQVRSIVSALTFPLFALAIGFYMVLAASQSGFAVNVVPGSVTESTTPGSPAAVLANHPECWTDNGQHPYPHHVIWQHPSGRTVWSEALTGRALATQFGSDSLPGTLIAFCK